MALLWSTDKNGTRYEVRQHGHSIRLYTSGAFHSAWNPNHLFSGGVWDLLTLATLQAPRNQRILLLGVGGGTVIHQLVRLLPDCHITAVEIDAVHLRIARREFGLATLERRGQVLLHHADARDWLRGSRSRFDVIIDDIFLHGRNDPERPLPADETWLELLIRRLKSGGSIVQNHLAAVDLRDVSTTKIAARRFSHHYRFTTGGYTNHILGLYPSAPGRETRINLISSLPAALRRRLDCHERRIRH